MIRIGVLSDTHLHGPTDLFRTQIASCFTDVSIILHAGDLVDLSLLEVFAGKEVHAVHGNMCFSPTRKTLPAKKVVQVGEFLIGLIHGTGFSANIEDRITDEFDLVDCIVYGHTHTPVCHRQGPVLFMNPGSFTSGSRYGARGTYGILEVGETLRGRIHQVSTGYCR